MIWQTLRRKQPNPAEHLYSELVTASRREQFFAEWGVPDTVDGRFDMIVLHLFLAIERLQAEGDGTTDLRQSLTDLFFKDMDRSLREMGVGDLSVGKKVRKMAEAYYGRIAAYSKAIEAGHTAVEEALIRNIFENAKSPGASHLAQWVLTARSALRAQSAEHVATAEITWP